MLDIAGAIALIFGIIGLICLLEDRGRKDAQNDQMRKTLDDIHKAKMARDSLNHDPAAAKRVRERFTR
jgi:hypothetical protein